MLLNKKRNVSDGVFSPLSCGDALQGEVSIERDSISWSVLSHTNIHETQSLHSGSNDETFVRRTRQRQYNPEAENRNSLVNILGRTIVNEDGSVTTNITEQQLPLLEGSLQSTAAEEFIFDFVYILNLERTNESESSTMNITVAEYDFCDDSDRESNNLSTSDPRRKHRKFMEVMNFGPPTEVCEHCGAQLWYEERTIKSRKPKKPKFSLCCSEGKVELLFLKDPPPFLKRLLSMSNDQRSNKFRVGIRIYNSLFAFTSLGGNIDRSVNNGTTPYLYIYDTKNEIANRIDAVTSGDHRKDVNIDIVIGLLNMLDNCNQLVKQYNLPDTSEVATIIVGDLNTENCERDIIVENQSLGLQHIFGSHLSYMTLQQYPLLLRLQQRSHEGNTLLLGGRLFQQFIVDAYTSIEEERLQWVRQNQLKLRSELYGGLKDAVLRGDTNPKTVGKRIILPSSFTRSPRYMAQNYQDAMTICRKVGYPDLFMTFTCNPKWSKITKCLEFIEGQNVEDQPDIKRGLPYAHILLFLDPKDKCPSLVDIDSIITVEIPDSYEDPIAYEDVKQFMMHGPCGYANPRSPCIVNEKCTKHFPKNFYEETTIDEEGFPIYRRRNDGKKIVKNGITLDNQYVVPYNVDLLFRNPPVERLNFHLENENPIIYPENANLEYILQRPGIKDTKFTEWMKTNEAFEDAHELTYAEFPTKWILQQYGKSLKDYPQMPQPNVNILIHKGNRLIEEEMSYDIGSLQREHEILISGLNNEQRTIYNSIMEAVFSESGGMFFVYGHGGTGKTYLYRTILVAVRSKGKIALAVASSGIVALLLPGGWIAHS
ncbi:uncharacterized protein LOC115964607 [Quercus lobata]|uniref:uncharacterized protein LOC115964607 n=1 Tax=Quercus lobata TaxID=97700 RepID=UPI001248BF55|nr:uncharacterized protein LOC115964607 [Quercus lobata]